MSPKAAIEALVTPEEIGYASVFLSSDRAACVTGQRIAVAAGFGL